MLALLLIALQRLLILYQHYMEYLKDCQIGDQFLSPTFGQVYNMAIKARLDHCINYEKCEIQVKNPQLWHDN
jgi:hypothetical protein